MTVSCHVGPTSSYAAGRDSTPIVLQDTSTSRGQEERFSLATVCPVFDSAAPAQTSETSLRSQGRVVLWFPAAAAQRARESQLHCSLLIHMNYQDASCCKQSGVTGNTLISLTRDFVFEFVNCIQFGAPPKDPAQKRFVILWDFRETGRFPSETTTKLESFGNRHEIRPIFFFASINMETECLHICGQITLKTEKV